MVTGINIFREHFSGYTDQYILIGGLACDLLMEEGIHVNSRDLRKHRQDVFRLFPLISPDARVAAPEEVYQDIMTFIDAVAELPFETKNIGVSISKDHILEVYRNLYYVKDMEV